MRGSWPHSFSVVRVAWVQICGEYQTEVREDLSPN